MRIFTLVENTLLDNSNLIKEHGLSMLIETSKGKILFDTGQSDAFVKNAAKLKIDLNTITHIVLSHAHYDHSNGLKFLLEKINSKPILIVAKDFFNNSNKFYKSVNTKNGIVNEELSYIGVNFTKEFIQSKKIDINYVEKDTLNISKAITVHRNFFTSNAFERINENMQLKLGENFIVDPFKDEIAIAIETKKGLLLLVGCSHCGIINTIETIKNRTNKNIYGVIGGTHLIEADEDRIDKTLEYFKNINLKFIGLSHCTGKKALDILKIKSNNYTICSTGKILDFTEIEIS
ncbi:ribonuclease BN [Clostridium homopropionicum DSM 5847]|uniref:Ribonuclease BN n=1 Tax=Clostridium homopropionicum DSM 5847 TaxID=1121318 RepID=A0A0L6Z9H4_9CLOT|nr:MBL fold metallo-hydrolase [Clostridium homopropionicum]KOA19438.1 ribonuclease BN [Clostridium homopropionicum DSM 5847]SFG69701.1 7,8-dihydropterin-6-yl-methyl-4-(beta-D-ribofuranosyl)aminobenzene 5'-phosphate synthase [Clostridium homopropionicum]